MPPLVSLQRDLCFVEVIEGETDGLERQLSESIFVDRLRRLGALLWSIEINDAGCFVIVASRGLAQLKSIVQSLNVAIRVHAHCGRILMRRGRGARLPSLADVISDLHRSSIRIVHIVAGTRELAILVDVADMQAALNVVTGFSRGGAVCSA